MTITRPILALLLGVPILLDGCGAAVGSEGGSCPVDDVCDPGLACTPDRLCERLYPTVTVALAGPDPVLAAGVSPCASHDSILAEMEARLEMGGIDQPCAIPIDSDTHTPAGTCPGVVVGLSRPMSLDYFLRAPTTSDLVPIAAVLGFVDLTEQGWSPLAITVVNLSADDVASQIIFTDEAVTALPDSGTCPAGRASELCRAQWWFKDSSAVASESFDRDSDGISNLQEACDGTF